MGDGTTSAAALQMIVAPAGATRLYLGTMDGYEWINNTGEFTVDIRTKGVPDSGSAVGMLAFVSLAMVAAAKRLAKTSK